MQRPRPKTIQIYLPSGDPRGIRIAELTINVVRVIEVPQNSLDEFMQLDESRQVGLYFLVGDDQEDDFPPVYIGQTGKTGQRLLDHLKSKDYWTRALVVVLSTDVMTQTHALYLEWLSIQAATKAGRFEIKNGNGGSKPHTTAPMEADCLEIFETVRILTATLGQPIFEPYATPREEAQSDDLFYCKSPSGSYDASAQFTDEGLVVLAGSKAKKEVAASMLKWKFGKRRETLIEEGALKLVDDVYVFQRDVLFRSPSGASDTIVGASTNGWISWKTKDGKTLDEIKRSSL